MGRRTVALAGLLLVSAFPLWAQNDYPRGEVFAGYSYLNVDAVDQRESVHGFEISGAGNFHRNFGIEGDFTGHFKEFFSINVSNYLFLAGPRVTARTDRATPFAHALFGVAHTRALGESTTNFAMALGGGLDINASRHVAIRVIQADYILVSVSESGFNQSLHNARFSAGVVFKWGGG